MEKINPSRKKKIPEITINEFPFLDMKLNWNFEENLNFSVYRKENQVLKYLEKGSCHTKATFEAIPSGVFNRLAKLTSKPNTNGKLRIDEVYPDHTNTLKNAGLFSKTFPTLENIRKSTEKSKLQVEEQKKRQRNVYFCAGYCHFWKTSINKIIEKLLKYKYL